MSETVAELKEKLRKAQEAEAAEKQKKRKEYEELKSEVIQNLCAQAKGLQHQLRMFKIEAFNDMQTIYELLKDYSSRHADGKGNFRIEYDNFRISYKRQGKPSFDERSHQAEKHIIDFVNSKFQEDQDTRDLVMSLLERKKGELDINLVQKLYAMEDRFQDDNWKRGIELLKESYSFSHSKDYISFEEKNDKGEWLPINLQFSNL